MNTFPHTLLKETPINSCTCGEMLGKRREKCFCIKGFFFVFFWKSNESCCFGDFAEIKHHVLALGCSLFLSIVTNGSSSPALGTEASCVTLGHSLSLSPRKKAVWNLLLKMLSRKLYVIHVVMRDQDGLKRHNDNNKMC